MSEPEESKINFIPCLKWVRRGVSKPEPERVKLSKEELIQVIEQTKGNIEGLNNEDSSDEKEEPEIKDESRVKSDRDIMAEYGLDDYDDEEEDEKACKLFGLGDLTVYANPSDDPYLDQDQPDEDEEDLEDFKIRATDNLILAGHVEGDAATLEVYVYNDVEDALYVHHDIVLPSLPLALEWLSFDPESDTKGSLVAIGTMLPEIQVWDLDIVDCLEPAFTLGRKGKKKKGIARIGHRDAVLSLAWNHQAEHVFASGSVDQTVLLWDLNQRTVASTFNYFNEKVQSLSWHPLDCQTLATGCCDKIVRVADCRTQDSFKEWRVTGEVESVIWNHFNPYQCVVATDAGSIHCIDVRHENPVWVLAAHTQDVTGLTLSSQCPGCLVSVSSDKSMKVWDISGDTPEFVMEKPAKMGVLQAVAGCPDAPFVVAMAGDKPSQNFKIFDIRESTTVRQRFGNRTLANPLNVTPFGYTTANEAEPDNEMETENAVKVMENMSLDSKRSEKDNTHSQHSTKHSAGAAAKFKKEKTKRKKNF